jgi:hypothetical protein
MADIQRKKNWHIGSPPYAPTKPTEPKEFYEHIKRESLIEATSEGFYGYELTDILSKYDPKDILIESEVEYGYYDSCMSKITVYLLVHEQKKSENYNKNLAHYRRELTKYNESKVAFKQEKKDWALWKKQEEERNKQDAIARAKKLLQDNNIKIK